LTGALVVVPIQRNFADNANCQTALNSVTIL
jgi:hypothetical protein